MGKVSHPADHAKIAVRSALTKSFGREHVNVRRDGDRIEVAVAVAATEESWPTLRESAAVSTIGALREYGWATSAVDGSETHMDVLCGSPTAFVGLRLMLLRTPA